MEFYNNERQLLEKDLARYQPIQAGGLGAEFTAIFGFCDRKKNEILAYKTKISEFLELGIGDSDKIIEVGNVPGKIKEKSFGKSVLNGKRQFETFSLELNGCHKSIENFLALVRCCGELLDLRLNCENEAKF